MKKIFFSNVTGAFLLYILLGHAYASTIESLLDSGRYLEAQRFVSQEQLEASEKAAVLAFIEINLSMKIDAYEMAQKGKGTILGDYASIICLFNGIGVKKNHDQAKEETSNLFKRINSKKDLTGFDYYLLAELAESLKDKKLQFYLDKACQMNIAPALNMQGRLLQEKGNFKEAYTYYKRSADLGMAEANKNLSYIYYAGLGVAVDKEKALECAINAAQGGDIYGMINLSVFYHEKNENMKAQEWIQKAAATGNPNGILELGYAYIYGKYGFTIDYEKGVKLIKESSKAGNSYAIFRLAELYSEGIGVKPDTKKAILLYKCAYKLGQPSAAGALCNIFNKTRKEDEAQFLYWMNKAEREQGAPQFMILEYSSECDKTGNRIDRFQEFDKELDQIDPSTISF